MDDCNTYASEPFSPCSVIGNSIAVDENCESNAVVDDINLCFPVYLNHAEEEDFDPNHTDVKFTMNEIVPVQETYSTLSLQDIETVFQQVHGQNECKENSSVLSRNEKMKEKLVIDDILSDILHIGNTVVSETTTETCNIISGDTVNVTVKSSNDFEVGVKCNTDMLKPIQNYINNFQPEVVLAQSISQDSEHHTELDADESSLFKEDPIVHNEPSVLSETGQRILTDTEVGIIHLRNDQISELAVFENVIVFDEKTILEETKKLDFNDESGVQRSLSSHTGSALSLVCQERDQFNEDRVSSNSAVNAVIIHQDSLKQLLDIVAQSSQRENVVDSTISSSTRKEDLVTCGYCKLQVATTEKLVKHMWKFHQEGVNLQKVCGFCHSTFEDRNALRKHIKTSHAVYSDPLECVICCKMFQTKKSLRQHERNHDDLKRYQCPLCGLFFKGAQPMIHHMTLNHPRGSNKKLLTCLLCNLSFSTESSFERHIRSRHLKKEHNNNVQSNIVSSSTNVEVKETGDNSEVPNYQCLKCCINSSRAEDILNHIDTVHKGSFECELCSIYFSYFSDFNEHSNQHRLYTMSLNKKIKGQCSRVSVATKSQDSSTKHQKMLKNGQLRCLICGCILDKTFFKKHVRAHQVRKTYGNEKSDNYFIASDVAMFTLALLSEYNINNSKQAHKSDIYTVSAPYRTWRKKLHSQKTKECAISRWKAYINENKHILDYKNVVCLICCEVIPESEFDNHIGHHFYNQGLISIKSQKRGNINENEEEENIHRKKKHKKKMHKKKDRKMIENTGNNETSQEKITKSSLHFLAEVAENIIKLPTTDRAQNKHNPLKSNSISVGDCNVSHARTNTTRKIRGALYAACQRAIKERLIKKANSNTNTEQIKNEDEVERQNVDSLIDGKVIKEDLESFSCRENETENFMQFPEQNLDGVMVSLEDSNEYYTPFEEKFKSSCELLNEPEIDNLPLGCEYIDFVAERVTVDNEMSPPANIPINCEEMVISNADICSSSNTAGDICAKDSIMVFSPVLPSADSFSKKRISKNEKILANDDPCSNAVTSTDPRIEIDVERNVKPKWHPRISFTSSGTSPVASLSEVAPLHEENATYSSHALEERPDPFPCVHGTRSNMKNMNISVKTDIPVSNVHDEHAVDAVKQGTSLFTEEVNRSIKTDATISDAKGKLADDEIVQEVYLSSTLRKVASLHDGDATQSNISSVIKPNACLRVHGTRLNTKKMNRLVKSKMPIPNVKEPSVFDEVTKKADLAAGESLLALTVLKRNAKNNNARKRTRKEVTLSNGEEKKLTKGEALVIVHKEMCTVESNDVNMARHEKSIKKKKKTTNSSPKRKLETKACFVVLRVGEIDAALKDLRKEENKVGVKKSISCLKVNRKKKFQRNHNKYERVILTTDAETTVRELIPSTSQLPTKQKIRTGQPLHQESVVEVEELCPVQEISVVSACSEASPPMKMSPYMKLSLSTFSKKTSRLEHIVNTIKTPATAKEGRQEDYSRKCKYASSANINMDTNILPSSTDFSDEVKEISTERFITDCEDAIKTRQRSSARELVCEDVSEESLNVSNNLLMAMENLNESKKTKKLLKRTQLKRKGRERSESGKFFLHQIKFEDDIIVRDEEVSFSIPKSEKWDEIMGGNNPEEVTEKVKLESSSIVLKSSRKRRAASCSCENGC